MVIKPAMALVHLNANTALFTEALSMEQSLSSNLYLLCFLLSLPLHSLFEHFIFLNHKKYLVIYNHLIPILRGFGVLGLHSSSTIHFPHTPSFASKSIGTGPINSNVGIAFSYCSMTSSILNESSH